MFRTAPIRTWRSGVKPPSAPRRKEMLSSRQVVRGPPPGGAPASFVAAKNAKKAPRSGPRSGEGRDLGGPFHLPVPWPDSTPGRIRTCNPRFRRPMRYPVAPRAPVRGHHARIVTDSGRPSRGISGGAAARDPPAAERLSPVHGTRSPCPRFLTRQNAGSCAY